jgi:peptidyl-prolyl cis-trans isomerase D
MMKIMRNAAKPIYLVVILAFVGTIIFAWGMDFTGRGKKNANIAGKINNTEISNEIYYRAYENKYQELLKTSPEPTEEQIANTRKEAWDGIVNEVLLNQQIAENKITLTDEELAQYVQVVPPGEFQKIPEFQNNGQFDMAKYQKYISELANSQDPRAEQMLMSIEQSVKAQVLNYKLQELVTASAVVPQSSVYDEYVNQNEKIQVKYIFISTANIDTSDIKPTDTEIKARYEKDKDNNYKIDQTATVRYVQINKAPTQVDADSVKNEIFQVYNQILGGADFAQVAKEVSQDNSATNGGDVGWVGKDSRMVEPFKEAALNLKKVGDISQPVQTQYGWHILKLTGRKTEKDPKNPTGPEVEQAQISHILLKVAMSEKSHAILKEQAEKLRQAAIVSNLDQAAKEQNQTVQETKPFAKGASIPGIGNNPQINTLGFEGKSGTISDIIETPRAIFVVTPGIKKPAGYRSLDEVKEQISRMLRAEKITDKAMAKGETMYKELSQGMTLDILGAKYNMPVTTTDPFARFEFVKNIGSDPGFIGASFTLSETKRLSKPVKGQTGCYLLEYVSHVSADITKYNAMSDSLYNSAFIKKRNDVWQSWFKAMMDKAKIENYTQQTSGA